MVIRVSKYIKKKIKKSETKEIFKIANTIKDYLNQKEANYLFLFVPIEVSHTKNIYKSVCKKMENFFYEDNYLNIDSVTVFGY